jgi:hypothetical protein
MKVRKSIVAAVAAVVLGATGALALPALASAHDGEGALEFTQKSGGSVTFTNNPPTEALQDDLINGAGKTIGFGMWYQVAGKTTITGNGAFDLSGGLLYGTDSSNNDGKTYKGTVTGGTGTFAGATGTIEVKNGDGKSVVKIEYKT